MLWDQRRECTLAVLCHGASSPGCEAHSGANLGMHNWLILFKEQSCTIRCAMAHQKVQWLIRKVELCAEDLPNKNQYTE